MDVSHHNIQPIFAIEKEQGSKHDGQKCGNWENIKWENLSLKKEEGFDSIRWDEPRWKS